VKIFQVFQVLIVAFLLNFGLIFVYFSEQDLIQELYYFSIIE